MQDWLRVKEAGADLMIWWDSMFKGGVKYLAVQRGKEFKKEKLGILNMLRLKQAYFTSQVQGNVANSLTELLVINSKILKWYQDESEKITIMSRCEDLNLNEKVRIFHHSQHQQFQKRSSILTLTTPQGTVTSHDACAMALESNVADHLLHKANLLPAAQEILLKEIKPSFTDDDNNKLKSDPTKSEIKKVLDSCRPHAAPGTDGLTVYFYQQFWDLVGDSLTEVICAVFKGTTPSPSQRTSLMVFGNKPGKKAKSLLISDRRKLSLINVDFKLMTGIEAARIRKTMSRTISHLQLVTGGDKRISQGVAMARDAIHAAGINRDWCGILDTDLITAFCNMVSTWCFSVM